MIFQQKISAVTNKDVWEMIAISNTLLVWPPISPKNEHIIVCRIKREMLTKNIFGKNFAEKLSRIKKRLFFA